MFDFKGEHILTAHTIPAAIDLHHGLDKKEGGGGGGDQKYCLGLYKGGVSFKAELSGSAGAGSLLNIQPV